MSFSEFLDFVLVRLYQAGSDQGGALHDVNQIAAELGGSLPEDWAWEATKVLDERGLVTAALAMGNAASATITGEGRIHVEQAGLLERPRQAPNALRVVSQGSHEWAQQNQRFLDLVFESFDATGDWPELHALQRNLLRMGEEVDVMTPAAALPQELGYREAPPEEKVILLVPALSYVAAASQILDDFMLVFRLAVERYLSVEDRPAIRRADLTEVLGLSDERSTKLSRILVRGTRFLGGGQTDLDSWELEIWPWALVPLRHVATIEEYLAATAPPPPPAVAEAGTADVGLAAVMAASPVFLVHGHDAAAKHEVARFVEKLAEPGVTILDEQPGLGRTIIEKFEDHAATAAFAIVLLTGDDEGRARGSDDWQLRARQNVILELGYFVGKLGRANVAMLYRPNVERPSDISGVSYIALDAAGAWKLELAREMKAAGIAVNVDRALGA